MQQIDSPPPSPIPKFYRNLKILGLIILIITLLGLAERWLKTRHLKVMTEELAIPKVSIVEPKAISRVSELNLPGNVQAYRQAQIYARLSGYLKYRHVDIGSKVKKNDVLAEIDSPEIDAQVRQAQADYTEAKARANIAIVTAKRWKTLLLSESVTRQEVEEKNADADVKIALEQSAQANYEKFKALEDFKYIRAPFDGVITARNTDIGNLINAGENGPSLFIIEDSTKLKIVVQIPQSESSSIAIGQEADLYLTDQPGQKFSVKLVRSATSIESSNRSVQVEFSMDNEKGLILSGSYADVHVKFPNSVKLLQIPSNSLIFRSEGLQIARVRHDNSVELVSVKSGRDFGNMIEIVNGITQDDHIIINPPDSLNEGQIVRIVTPEESKKR
jgi:RND family efflux transporter MFP subunit